MSPMARQAVQLTWSNKDRPLLIDDRGDLAWVDPSDHRVAEVRLLHQALTVGELSDNLLVRGDALHALRSLLQSEATREKYAGQVRLCYIDPPFNTGERSFAHYDDAIDTSAWLTMLRDRLLQVQELLAPDGSVWVHLDDSEQHRARCVLDEVFGTQSFVATIIWQKRTSRDNRKAFSSMHDYIHVYAPMGPVAWRKRRNGLPDDGAFANPDNDPKGPWRSVPLTAQNGHATAAQYYTIVSPTGVSHEPPPGRCWTYSSPRFQELVRAGRVYWPRNGDGKPRLKRYKSEVTGLAPFTIWMAEEVGDNATTKKSLMAQFPDEQTFDTPKPEALLERIIHIATDPGDVVLDCFLGSGTTAVVAQQMRRKWIGIERSSETVARWALPRLRAEIDRAPEDPGFRVVDVSPSMFEEDGVGGVQLSAWVTSGFLAEATAAQLGYRHEPDGMFAGRNGQTRLAVMDARVDRKLVGILSAALGPGELLDLAATHIDPSAKRAILALGEGHKVHQIPESILQSYRRSSRLSLLLDRDTGAGQPTDAPHAHTRRSKRESRTARTA